MAPAVTVKWAKSSNFECSEGKSGESCCQEPEADDHLWFTPSGQVEMMVYRGTSEESFSAGISEISDLQDYAEQFNYKDASDN